MDDVSQLIVTHLMRRADHCRRLASRAESRGVAVELEKLASDYALDAAQYETRQRETRIA